MKIGLSLLALVFCLSSIAADHGENAASNPAPRATPPAAAKPTYAGSGFPKIELQQTYHGFKAGQRPLLAEPGAGQEELNKAAKALVEKSYLPKGCEAVLDYGSRGVLSYTYKCNGIAFPRAQSVMVDFDEKTNEVRLVRTRAVPQSIEDETATVDEKDATRIAREAFEKELNLPAARVEKPVLTYITDEKGVGRLSWAISISSSKKPIDRKARNYLLYVTAIDEEPKVIHTENHSPLG